MTTLPDSSYEPPQEPDRDSPSHQPEAEPEIQRAGLSRRSRAGLLLLIVSVAAGLYFAFRETLTLEALAQYESQLRAYQSAHPALVYLAALIIYVIVTGLSLPGATVLSLLYGWYFGFAAGFILVSFASTAGATVAFLLSRYLFRDWVQAQFGSRLAVFNQSLQREGPFYLFSLRMIPAVPFFVINAVMGLTALRVSTFWWVSQLGMLPGTAVYLYAGSRVPGLQQLADEGLRAVFNASQLTQIFTAFVLLGSFPLLARWAIRYFGAKTHGASAKPNVD